MAAKKKTPAAEAEQEDTLKDTAPEPEQANEPTPAPEEPQAPSLEEQLAAAQQEARGNWDQYLRARAEMDNLRKRTQREKEDLARFANENILRDILPVIDNLERAVAHAGNEPQGSGGLFEGVEMTLSQFAKVLEKFGVTPVEALGQPFDPAFHEAMGQLESSDQPANTVVQELQKGYLLNDRLLRPALVMIAKPVPEETDA